MKINQFINESRETILREHMQASYQILTEACKDMDVVQRKVVTDIYEHLRPLIEDSKLYESALTADQVKSIFTSIEQGATAGGGNRTLLGKGKDIADKANEIIDSIGSKLKDTAPVKGADAKYNKLKADIGQKFPKLEKSLTSLGTLMKENPGKTAAVIGVLTSLASLAGGPIGGAIAGQVLRGASELIKGADLSTAIGKGLKTAALGFIAGAVMDKLGDWLSGFRADVVMKDTFADVSYGATKTLSGPGWKWTEQLKGLNIRVLPDDAEYVNDLMQAIGQGGDTGVKAFDQLATFAKEIGSDVYKQQLADVGAEALSNDAFYQVMQSAKEGLTAASQGAVAAAGAAGDKGDKKESKMQYMQTKPLSEGQVYMVFNLIEQRDILVEGPVGDKLKGIAGKAMAKAGEVGKNLTTKVTASKLNKAWQKAGSPTDSNELAQFLRQQGVSDEVIAPVYKQMKLKVPKAQAADQEKKLVSAPKGVDQGPNSKAAGGTGGTAVGGMSAKGGSGRTATAPKTYAEVKKVVLSLTAKDKRRLLKYISKKAGAPA